jgi:hypothetical protein
LEKKQTRDRQRLLAQHAEDKKRKPNDPKPSTPNNATSSVDSQIAASGMIEERGDEDDEWATSGRHFQYGVRRAFFDLFPVLLRNYRKVHNHHSRLTSLIPTLISKFHCLL